MNYLRLENYNLEATLFGGQDFNWQIIDGEYWAFLQKQIIRIKPTDGGIYWQTYPDKDNYTFIRNYLGLRENYEEIINYLQNEKNTAKAIKYFPGLRILNQNFDQTVLNFIMSANKNLPAIRNSIKILIDEFGETIKVEGKKIKTYPSTSLIAKLTTEELAKTKVGYRAPYIKKTAKRLLKDLNQNRETLISLPGIGPKVSDCILTYSVGARDITPIDRWGFRIYSDLYGNAETNNYDKVRDWFTEKFGEYTAYAGQFLFEYMRNIVK